MRDFIYMKMNGTIGILHNLTISLRISNTLLKKILLP